MATIDLRLRFDDAIALARVVAGHLHASELPANDLAALRRVFDELARSGAGDWNHAGLTRGARDADPA